MFTVRTVRLAAVAASTAIRVTPRRVASAATVAWAVVGVESLRRGIARVRTSPSEVPTS